MSKRSQRRKLEMYGYTSDGRASSSITAPTNTSLPTQVGPAKVGTLQTVNPGVWTGSYARVSYQWKITAAAVPGATGIGYTPVVGDVTKALTCTVTGANSAGSASATTAPATVIP